MICCSLKYKGLNSLLKGVLKKPLKVSEQGVFLQKFDEIDVY
jgi:hypothetical protein